MIIDDFDITCAKCNIKTHIRIESTNRPPNPNQGLEIRCSRCNDLLLKAFVNRDIWAGQNSSNMQKLEPVDTPQSI